MIQSYGFKNNYGWSKMGGLSMTSKLEQVEKNIVKLTIEVDAAVFEEAMEKSFKKNAGRFSVQGFRKGKAPRKIVERIYGEYTLYDDAVNFVVPSAYDEAVAEHKLVPVDRPEVDVEKIGGGNNFVFTALVTVKPEVKLGKYKGLKLEKEIIAVTDEDIENEVKKEAEKNSRLVSVMDRPVKEQDTVYLDFEGFVDGVAFEGGKGENYPLVIGSGSFIPGFEEQLIGAELNQDTEVKVTFPEDYQSDELKGKEAIFKCKINEIKYKELPTIDDEFIQDISEFNTIDEYKADIKDKLEKAAEDKATVKHENTIIEKVSEKSEIDIPKVMVDKQVDAHIRDFEQNLRYQGMNLEQYISMLNTTMEDFRNNFAENSEKEVKAQLVIEEISKVEKIECTQEDKESKIAEIAVSYKKEPDEIKGMLREEDYEYICDQVIYKKTIDLLVELNSK